MSRCQHGQTLFESILSGTIFASNPASLRENCREAGFNPAGDGMAATYLTPEDFAGKHKRAIEVGLRQALGLV